jgi:arabinan endo-1,5-alpha-L-arabinosidase
VPEWRQAAEALYAQDGGHGMLFLDFGGRLWMTLHRPNNSPNERPMWVEVVESDGGLACIDT